MSFLARLKAAAWGYLGEQAAQRGHHSGPPPAPPYTKVVPSAGGAGATGPKAPKLSVASGAGAPGDSGGPDSDPDAPARPEPRMEEYHKPATKKTKLRRKVKWGIALVLIAILLWVLVSCFRGGGDVVKVPVGAAPEATVSSATVPAEVQKMFAKFSIKLPSVYAEGQQYDMVGFGLQAINLAAVKQGVVEKKPQQDISLTKQDTAECPAGDVDTRPYNVRYCKADGTYWVSDVPDSALNDKIIRDIQNGNFPMLTDLVWAYARYVIEGSRGLTDVTGGAVVSQSNWHCTVGEVAGAIDKYTPLNDAERAQLQTGFGAGAKKAFAAGFKSGCAKQQ